MDESIELLKKLISSRPVSGNFEAVNGAVAILADYLSAHGIHCEIQDFNGLHALYAAKKQGKIKDYLFNAHLDVVSAVNESQYMPEERDGILYARGSVDCLGPAVCLASLLIEAPADTDFGVIFSSDEETDGETTRNMLAAGYTARKSAIICDGKYEEIAYAQKGVSLLKLTAAGKGGHTAYPWDLDNPIDKLFSAYVAFAETWRNPPENAEWANSIVPCVVSAGKQTNQAPDSAELILNIRFIDEKSLAEIFDRISAQTHLQLKETMHVPPMICDPNHPELQRLNRIMRCNLPSHNVQMARMNGATDARFFSRQHIPVAIVGLDGNGEHSANEYLRLSSIQTMKDIFIDYISGN